MSYHQQSPIKPQISSRKLRLKQQNLEGFVRKKRLIRCPPSLCWLIKMMAIVGKRSFCGSGPSSSVKFFLTNIFSTFRKAVLIIRFIGVRMTWLWKLGCPWHLKMANIVLLSRFGLGWRWDQLSFSNSLVAWNGGRDPPIFSKHKSFTFCWSDVNPCYFSPLGVKWYANPDPRFCPNGSQASRIIKPRSETNLKNSVGIHGTALTSNCTFEARSTGRRMWQLKSKSSTEFII